MTEKHYVRIIPYRSADMEQIVNTELEHLVGNGFVKILSVIPAPVSALSWDKKDVGEKSTLGVGYDIVIHYSKITKIS